MKKQRRHNSTYKKLAVLCLNEALCFVSSSVLVDSLVLRNRQLLVAAKRYAPLRLNNDRLSYYFLKQPQNNYKE